jgi:hypothetical protein
MRKESKIVRCLAAMILQAARRRSFQDADMGNEVTIEVKEVVDVSETPGTKWVEPPLEVGGTATRGGPERTPRLGETTVEFDEGEDLLTPKINERFGSHDLTRPPDTSSSSPTTSRRRVSAS